jgi:peptidoglycan hydrolase CwlO-like protein
VIVEPEESKEGKEDILELKRKTFEKIEELAEREHDLQDRRRVLIQARKDLENLRVELAEREEELTEKEAHLTLWEEELRAMGKKVANERSIPLGVPTQASPQPQKKRKLFGLGRRRKSTSKPS